LHPTFPEAELERERLLLIQDIVTREDKPSGVAFELFNRTLFTKHPYRLHTYGELSSVERLTAGNLRAYHERHLHPSQMTLCIVGDVKTDEALAVAHEAFGRAEARPRAQVEIPLDAPPEAPRSVKRELKRAQSHVVYGFQGARVTDPWRRGLELLSSILSGQGGRLFVELRDKRSLAYSVGSYAVEGIDPGYFAVYIGTSPEKVDQALAGIRTELERARAEPPSAAELQRAQRHLIGTHEIGLQRNGARAAVLALDHCYGLGNAPFLHYAEEIMAVTAENVRSAAERVLQFEHSAQVVVGP
jgi:zinc protease